MSKGFFILTFCFVLQPVWGIPATAHTQTPKRNQAGYETIGPYTIGDEPGLEKDLRFTGEIRLFLWNHWKERRLGQVTATFYTIEGEPTTATFSVQPDAKGHWHLKVDSVSIIAALLPRGKLTRRTVAHEYYDEVNRVETTSTNQEDNKPLSESDVREPQLYMLRLRNSATGSEKIF